MKAYIDKTALVAEIEKELNTTKKYSTEYVNGKKYALNKILSFLDTLEVKDANEALHTEYEKGRADVIADTLSWLENCCPKYCSNQTIIEGYKKAIKGE